MGILDRIKQAFTPRPSPTLDDPQFGRIVFCEPDSWQVARGHEREVTFAPTQEQVDFTVSDDERGPSSQVRELYRELQSRYTELIPSIAPLLPLDVLVNDQAIAAVPVPAIKHWVAEHLGTTLTSTRAVGYKEFATNSV